MDCSFAQCIVLVSCIDDHISATPTARLRRYQLRGLPGGAIHLVDNLKDIGVFVYGAEAGGLNVYDTDITGACAVVLGSEGEGISRLVKSKCDFIVSIPMYGSVNSYNVSCAAAIILSESARKRHK